MSRADPAAAGWPRPAFTVRRSHRARRSRLTVDHEGAIVVVLPRRAPLSEADRLVGAHRRWLERQLARVEAEQAGLASRPALGAGRTLLVDGRPMTVSEASALGVAPARGRVEVVGERAIVRVGEDGRDTPVLLERWLREVARARLAERVAARAAEMSIRPGRLTVRDQRSRWASASARGSLSFSWRLILVPPFVLDAVVVHELAHLRVRGHSRAFWTLVERHAPRTPEARRWLREHAREVRAALA